MEPSAKFCVSICIFAPAFIYFLYAVTNSPKVEDLAPLVRESDMIFVSQKWDPKERKKAAFLANKYNQNILPQEYVSLQIHRGNTD